MPPPPLIRARVNGDATAIGDDAIDVEDAFLLTHYIEASLQYMVGALSRKLCDLSTPVPGSHTYRGTCTSADTATADDSPPPPMSATLNELLQRVNMLLTMCGRIEDLADAVSCAYERTRGVGGNDGAATSTAPERMLRTPSSAVMVPDARPMGRTPLVARTAPAPVPPPPDGGTVSAVEAIQMKQTVVNAGLLLLSIGAFVVQLHSRRV